ALILFFLRLRVSSTLRLRIGAEISIAGRRGRRRIERTRAAEGGRPGPESAGARPRRTAGTRPESAWRWRTAGSAIFTRARLADCQRPAVEDLSVEALDRLFRVRAIRVFHEGEAARAACFAIDGQHDL